VFDGVRGELPLDKDALVDLLLTVSAIVENHPDISELDLNPVIAYDKAYAIVDARIIVSQEK
jgi:acetyltransferase